MPYFDDASSVIYTRVGALSSDTAKIVVRYPAPNATENSVRLSWRQVPKSSEDAPWREGPLANLTVANDWVQTVRLSGLWPKTTYECTSHTVVPRISTPLIIPTRRPFPGRQQHAAALPR